jgi:hypothetical protein
LNKCIFKHRHFRSFLLTFLLSVLLFFFFSFWVCSCSVMTLSILNVIELSFWTTSIYVLVVLKNSIFLSAVLCWFSQLSQKLKTHFLSAVKNSLTKITSLSNVSANFRSIISCFRFFQFAIHCSIFALTDDVFSTRHVLCSCSLTLASDNWYLVDNVCNILLDSAKSSFEEKYIRANSLIAFCTCMMSLLIRSMYFPWYWWFSKLSLCSFLCLSLCSFLCLSLSSFNVVTDLVMLIEIENAAESQSSKLLFDNQRHLMNILFLKSLLCHRDQQISKSQHSLLWSWFSLLMCESFWKSVKWLRRWQIYLHLFCLNDKKMLWKRNSFIVLFCCYSSLSLSISSIRRQKESSFPKGICVSLSLF